MPAVAERWYPTAMGIGSVSSGKVTGRRTLRFQTLADLRAEVDRIEAAERAGRLQRSGRWTVGQTFGHLASWMGYPYDGFPMGPAPWPLRAFVRLRRKRYPDGPMPVGLRIPGVPEGTVGVEDLTLDEGISRLRREIERFESGAQPSHPSPIFGPLSHEEWTRLGLRHAELHLSFLHPE
jgi:hypothetical protein